MFLFSTASSSCQGFNSSCSLYQSFTIPLGTLLKCLLQMPQSEKKFWVGFFCSNFTVSLPSFTQGCYLPSTNALGSLIVPTTKIRFRLVLRTYMQSSTIMKQILFPQTSTYSSLTFSHTTIAWTRLAGPQFPVFLKQTCSFAAIVW